MFLVTLGGLVRLVESSDLIIEKRSIIYKIRELAKAPLLNCIGASLQTA